MGSNRHPSDSNGSLDATIVCCIGYPPIKPSSPEKPMSPPEIVGFPALEPELQMTPVSFNLELFASPFAKYDFTQDSFLQYTHAKHLHSSPMSVDHPSWITTSASGPQFVHRQNVEPAEYSNQLASTARTPSSSLSSEVKRQPTPDTQAIPAARVNRVNGERIEVVGQQVNLNPQPNGYLRRNLLYPPGAPDFLDIDHSTVSSLDMTRPQAFMPSILRPTQYSHQIGLKTYRPSFTFLSDIYHQSSTDTQATRPIRLNKENPKQIQRAEQQTSSNARNEEYPRRNLQHDLGRRDPLDPDNPVRYSLDVEGLLTLDLKKSFNIDLASEKHLAGDFWDFFNDRISHQSLPVPDIMKAQGKLWRKLGSMPCNYNREDMPGGVRREMVALFMLALADDHLKSLDLWPELRDFVKELQETVKKQNKIDGQSIELSPRDRTLQKYHREMSVYWFRIVVSMLYLKVKYFDIIFKYLTSESQAEKGERIKTFMISIWKIVSQSQSNQLQMPEQEISTNHESPDTAKMMKNEASEVKEKPVKSSASRKRRIVALDEMIKPIKKPREEAPKPSIEEIAKGVANKLKSRTQHTRKGLALSWYLFESWIARGGCDQWKYLLQQPRSVKVKVKSVLGNQILDFFHERFADQIIRREPRQETNILES